MGTTESVPLEQEHRSSPSKHHHETPNVLNKTIGRQDPRKTSGSTTEQGSQPSLLPLCCLSGALHGLPVSGKKSLLKRLKGRDPFNSDDSHSSLSHIVAPYKAPPGHDVWDRIQLRVHTVGSPSEKSEVKEKENVPVDFSIVMINPRHDRKEVSAHLSQSMSLLLHRQGYGSHSKMRKKRPSNSPMTLNPRPVCVCLVLGFLDRKSSSNGSETWLTESAVQAMLLEGLMDAQKRVGATVEPSLLQLQCISVSLLDCYGLSAMHHFIYRSYLAHKQWELWHSLLLVQQATKKTSITPKLPAYSEYLKLVQQPNATAAIGTVPNKHCKKKKRKSKLSTPQMPVVDGDNADKINDTVAGKKSEEEDTRRTTVVPQASTTESTATTKISPVDTLGLAQKALEAFLMDSDDENDTGGTTDRAKRDVALDDEDDEVFYDESGKRRTSKANESTETDTDTELKEDGGNRCGSEGLPEHEGGEGNGERARQLGSDDSELEGDRVEKAGDLKHRENSTPLPQGTKSRTENASDDDGGDDKTKERLDIDLETEAKSQPSAKENMSETAPSRISAAARIAILAAQQEAEKMLEDEQQKLKTPPKYPKKKGKNSKRQTQET